MNPVTHFQWLTPKQLGQLRERIKRNSERIKGGCWKWVGSQKRNRCGTAYGRLSFRINGELRPRAWSAHVVSYMAFRGGRHTVGLVRAHTCHEPLCVNPNHIVEVTQSENLLMSSVAGRLGKAA